MSERQDLAKRDVARRIARVEHAADPAKGAADLLLAHFARAGFLHAELPILQPAEPFLELSGEDIRRRLFVTTDDMGEELCLRPEFTIPAALAYLKAGIAGRRADLAYIGPVFRHRPGETGEFTQLSAESFGRTDREAADADILAETHACITKASGSEDIAIRIGDLALFAGLLAGLSLKPVWVRRLSLALAEGRIGDLLAAAEQPDTRQATEARGLQRYSGVLDALKGADPREAKAFVKDMLSLAGISVTGGRSAEDIASRFLDRAGEEAQPLGIEQATIIRRFLGISGEPDAVARELRGLSDEAGLGLDAAIDRFEMRTGFIDARGLPLARIEASAGFARNIDYYSGFVFDLRVAGAERPVAAGGRYDRLFERLGHAVPGIGVAVWIERLQAEGAQA